MGESDEESSNYTESQVSERDEDEMSDDNTVQQNGSMIVIPNVEESDEHNISVAMK